jgi:molybdopterin molybdotransferase
VLPVEDAVAHIAAAFTPLPAETVGLETALGRVLAQDVTARLTQPPADMSAMDGWAVRAADVERAPVSLRMIGTSQAGARYAGAVGAGEAVRIFTGAVVPDGADTVVIQEHAEAADARVTVRTRARPGRHIRRKGQDFAAGDLLLEAGRRLSARDLGLAAAMNVPWLAVRRKPRVAVLATGDELVLPGEPLGEDRIVSSGSIAAAAFLRGFGAVPLTLGIARDDEASLGRAVAAARGCDLLLTIGGASVGDFDLVGRLFGTAEARLGFYKVAMRPGKPLLFGRLGELPLLGLPGNPVSACVTLLVFGKPAVDAMLGLDGATGSAPPTAVLGRALPANDERQDYLRATLTAGPSGEPVAIPFAVQDSAMLRVLAQADCLIVRPPHAPAAAAGARVAILPLDMPPLLG